MPSRWPAKEVSASSTPSPTTGNMFQSSDAPAVASTIDELLEIRGAEAKSKVHLADFADTASESSPEATESA